MNAPTPLTGEERPYRDWIETFMRLGYPAGSGDAFFDMHPDDILFSNGNVHVTVGDVRELQKHLMELGHQRHDRLTELMKALPGKDNPQ